MSVGQLDIQDPCFLLCAWHMHTSDFVTKEKCQYEIFKLLLLDSHFSCVCLVGHVTLVRAQFGPRNLWRFDEELEYCSMNKGEVAKRLVHKVGMKIGRFCLR